MLLDKTGSDRGQSVGLAELCSRQGQEQPTTRHDPIPVKLARLCTFLTGCKLQLATSRKTKLLNRNSCIARQRFGLWAVFCASTAPWHMLASSHDVGGANTTQVSGLRHTYEMCPTARDHMSN